MIKVIPISPIERKHCAYCAKGLTPCIWSNEDEVKTEDELKVYTTNRRVIGIRRIWWETRDMRTGDPDGKRLHHISIKFFPLKDSHWGVDGIFCSKTCAQRFAWSAHNAGYRLKKKDAA